jgi:signal transduction histidine kinase
MADISPMLVDRLLAISRALAGQIDPGAALNATADEIGTLIAHDHMDVAVLLHGGRDHACYEARMHTSWSRLAEEPSPTELSPVRSVLWGEVPYLLSADALTDERFHFAGAIDEPIFAARLRSRIIVPLRVRGDIIGALTISRHAPGCYTPADVEVAQQCADFVAPYIHALTRSEEARRAALAENKARIREEFLRVGALRLTEGMERERRRLAMDLHDQTLADMARLVRQVAALRNRGGVSADEMAELESEMAACLTELRHIIDDMRPGVLDLFGFADAVEAHLNRSVRGVEPPIAVGIRDRSEGIADRLSDTVRTALYRIVQEAINNAARHGAPGRIDVRIDTGPDGLRVVVTDDGSGCGPVDRRARGGIGHMQTRAALIGASLRIERAQEARGTRVTISLGLGRPRAKAPRAWSRGLRRA